MRRRSLHILFGSVLVAYAIAVAGCKSTTPTVPAPSATPPRGAVAPVTPDTGIGTVTPRVGSTARAAASTTVVARVGTPGLFVLSAGGATPDSVAIATGKIVTWRNDDSVPHRIVSDEAGLFETAAFDPGESTSITLTAPGIHDWHDPAKPTIRGSIRVIP